MKLRWLDLELPIIYCGRAAPQLRGQPCRVLTIARRHPRNVLIEFPHGHRTVTPLGCLRNRQSQVGNRK